MLADKNGDVYKLNLKENQTKPVLGTVQFSMVLYGTVRYSSVQNSTVQYSTVQCSTVQYRTK